MDRPNVFLSYHFDGDAERADLFRSLGAVHAPEPESHEAWRAIRRSIAHVSAWVDGAMHDKDAVIVLIGARTWSRQLVHLEIERAIALHIPLFGVRVHNLLGSSPHVRGGGLSPFRHKALTDSYGRSFPRKVFNPDPADAAADIVEHLVSWVGRAWHTQKRHDRPAEVATG